MFIRNLYKAFVIFFFLTLFGCGALDTSRTKFIHENPEILPKNAGYVEVYFEGIEPTYKYQQVGLVAIQDENYRQDDYLLNLLKYKAWENGADAIVHVKRHEGEHKRFEGIAIKYLSDENNLQELNDLSKKVDSTMFKAAEVRKKHRETDNALLPLNIIVLLGIGYLVLMAQHKQAE